MHNAFNLYRYIKFPSDFLCFSSLDVRQVSYEIEYITFVRSLPQFKDEKTEENRKVKSILSV